MRNPTIWESASRPLFVRSVWLETARSVRERPGQRQRHFLLDYAPGQQTRPLNWALGSISGKGRTRQVEDVTLRQSLSCDLAFLSPGNEGTSSTEDLLLIGSAKVHQVPPLLQQHTSKMQCTASQQRSASRRNSLVAKTHRQVNSAQLGQLASEQCDLISRRSSFQDPQSMLSNGGNGTNLDERLAERVLNWLDLAGKTDFLKPQEGVLSPSSAQEATTRRSASVTRHTGTHRSLERQLPPTPKRIPLQRGGSTRRRVVHPKSSGGQHYSASTARPSMYMCHQRRPDSMKHISITFNREGVPVRLNRPARTIDLASVAYSASTARRLTGALASARLYRSTVDCTTDKAPISARVRRQPTPRMATHEDHREEGNRQQHKRLQDDYSDSTPRSLRDAKKQLHIFMPGLPKKSALAANLLSGDVANADVGADEQGNALSGSFNELCKL